MKTSLGQVSLKYIILSENLVQHSFLVKLVQKLSPVVLAVFDKVNVSEIF